MTEIEVKILGIDKDEMQKKLEKIGAELIRNEYQINTVYDDEDESISAPGSKTYLRIRETEDRISGEKKKTFTLKTLISKEGARKSEELNVSIDSKDNLEKILNFLGVYKKYAGSKHRISYEFRGIRFDIDEWDKNTYPEPYMEIEADSIEALNEILNLLNIQEESVSTKSITELRRDIGLE